MVRMDYLIRLLDQLYENWLIPLFTTLAEGLTLVFLTPLSWLHVPAWGQVFLVGVMTGCFSLWLRHLLRVEEKVRRFQELFAEKRRRQQDLQLIADKYSRAALYELTDEELNDDFNTYLAHHYARYVTIYMLPIFLVLAWLSRVFGAGTENSAPVLLPLPGLPFGMEGLNMTALFLLAYLLTLVVGFRMAAIAPGRNGDKDR